MKRGFILLCFIALLGCAKGTHSDTPKILYGKEKCNQCNMIIAEERFSAVIKSNNEVSKFDDIGCSLQFYKKQTGSIEAFWIRDFETGEWLKAQEAQFVHSSDLISPMGFGIAGFSDNNSTKHMAERLGGRVLTFDQLKNL